MMTETEPHGRVLSHGKFFSRNGHKFFLKGMRLEGVGATLDFDQKLRLLHRFEKLNDSHTTTLILTEAQANPVLDLARQAGLESLIELEVSVDELCDPIWTREAASRIAHMANVLAGRHGLLGYLINCPVQQDQLRATGLDRARRTMRCLIQVIRNRDANALVALRHRPETRALALLDEDFIYGEVPAMAPVELRDLAVSFHNIAEARPLVLEFSEASPGQDEAVAVAFGAGAAGVVAPPVPAPVSKDWLGAKVLRASELMPFVTLNGTCPPALPRTPMVSVVICAYNAERTMRACLESLTKLEYPNFEVVIVDDGSRDSTADIAKEFPQFRLIRQPNKGLSVARNVGMQAAVGEIVAYTDSDCVVDPHWLTLMVRTMLEKGFDGCGGPNYAPHEEGRIEACCAASPGAPCHVLVADDVAEHLAGCNMVFTKAALLKIGGFDPQFTAAGDDVDACWRMLDSGLRLGFCPAAFVWHFRRNTIKAYYGQQRGYGRAEAMLYARYPERFNILGQIKWQGTIPGFARTVPGGSKRRVMWSSNKRGLATVMDPAMGLLRFLPQTLEWTVLWAIVALASVSFGVTIIPALAMLSLGPIWALHYAVNAPIEKCHRSLTSRILVAYLAYTGPMIRTITRYKILAKAERGAGTPAVLRQKPSVRWSERSVRLAYWNENWTPRDTLLEHLTKFFARTGHPSIVDPGWNDYDLEILPSPFTRIELKTADEEHEGGRLKNHVASRIRLTRLSKIGLAGGAIAALVSTALSMPVLAFGFSGLTLAFAACVIAAMIESGRLAYRAVEECASELNLIPLGKPVAPSRAAEKVAGLVVQPATVEASTVRTPPAP